MTEEKQRWNEYPFDQHSLAPSRLDSSALSDGGYSDGTPEYEGESQNTKKGKKKSGGLIGVCTLATSLVVCKVIKLYCNIWHIASMDSQSNGSNILVLRIVDFYIGNLYCALYMYMHSYIINLYQMLYIAITHEA